MATPKYWLITNRAAATNGFTSDKGPLTFWISDGPNLTTFKNWKQVSQDNFKTLLVAAADSFPLLPHDEHEEQCHVTFFVHGYNNDWQEAAARYQKLCASLFDPKKDGLGLCIAFDWPSYGSVIDYLPDRAHARACAADLADVLSELYDWLLVKQADAANEPADACKAKVSMISHSMGNYVAQRALGTAWTRKNQPLLVSLLNQLVMVAADVDADIFEPTGDDAMDGNAIANLTYRITALYSGRDAVLGASAGLKHFGTRRLGRSGLAVNPPTNRDNVWEVDCSSFFPASVGGMDIHSRYFEQAGTIELMRSVLRGLDRSVLESTGQTQGKAWP